MKKFNFLVKYGLKKRLGRKAFLIANIVIFFVLAVVINIPAIINMFSKTEEVTEMNIAVVTDEYNNLDKDLESILNENLPSKFYNVSKITDFDEESFWESDEYEIVLMFTDNNVVELYSKNNEVGKFIFQIAELQIIRYQIENYSPLVPHFNTAPDYEDEETQALVSSLTMILALPLFMLITLSTQFIGVEIIEEKSTKAIETIIASVPAKIHFLSKIVSAVIFVIVQGLLLIVFSYLATLITKLIGLTGGAGTDTGSLLGIIGNFFPNWRLIILITLMFIVFGTLVYLVIAALFASMAVTQEDYQQFQSPLMLILLAGFYIGIFAPIAGGSKLLKIVSFIPIFSPMVTPIAYAGGAITLFEAIISLVVVILFLVLLVYIVAPVYRVAILSYDQTKFMKRIKSYFKKGFTK